MAMQRNSICFMKLTTFLPLALALTYGACSSTPTQVNSGTIHAQTFNFVSRKSNPPTYTDDREVVHQMIQRAITKTLAARGVNRVSSGGDVIVAYLVITGNNVSTEAISDYFGYREDLSELHDRAHNIYTGNKNPDRFEAGTLLIDIIDARSFKLLKRGYATRPLMQHLPASTRAARIQEVVDEILRDVRIGP